MVPRTLPSVRLESVNVGRPELLAVDGKSVLTAIGKRPVAGPVPVRGVHVGDDVQAWTKGHGGPDQVAYAYAAEDAAWWSSELGVGLGPGAFGENLTTSGLDVTGALVGERWRIGTVTFRVSGPRIPCRKLAAHLGVADMVKRFERAGRPGAYLAVVEEGVVAAGDAITVEHRPDHGLTVVEVARIYHRDRIEAPRLLAVSDVPAGWREWATSRAG